MTASAARAEPSRNEARRRERILQGGRDAFLRFGFERTTMADIAAAAGVSRTALYHYFDSKEPILRALVEAINAEQLAAAEAALAEPTPRAEKLRRMLDARLGATLRLLRESAHAEELGDAPHRVVGPAALEADRAFVALVAQALDGDAERAETLVLAAKGLMRGFGGFESAEPFGRRLRVLTDLFAST